MGLPCTVATKLPVVALIKPQHCQNLTSLALIKHLEFKA